MLIILLIVSIVAAAALVLVWLNRQANRMNEFFLAAATAYFLFDDLSARRAALLVAVTAVGQARTRVIAVLRSVEQMPDTLVTLFVSAAGLDNPELSGKSFVDLAATIRSRAGQLLADVSQFNGNLVELRQELFLEAPQYERALGGFTTTDPTVFPKLKPEGMERIYKFFS